MFHAHLTPQICKSFSKKSISRFFFQFQRKIVLDIQKVDKTWNKNGMWHFLRGQGGTREMCLRSAVAHEHRFHLENFMIVSETAYIVHFGISESELSTSHKNFSAQPLSRSKFYDSPNWGMNTHHSYPLLLNLPENSLQFCLHSEKIELIS